MIHLKNKKIAVFGLGVSGISAVRLLCSLGAHVYAINQGAKEIWAKSPGVLDYIPMAKCLAEESEAIEFIKSQDIPFDMLILSPGIPRDHRIVLSILSKNPNAPIWGEIELAYRSLEEKNLLSPIVGITGTNGKTTTTTLIGELLSAGSLNVFVGGNIGVPFCDYAYETLANDGKKKDVIVLELSSFQLESLEKFHVDVALLLNVFQNHGERYQTIFEYAQAKFKISNRFHSDSLLIYAEDVPIINDWAKTLKCQKIPLSYAKLILYFKDIGIDTESFKLPGEHNLFNLAFAVAVALHFNIDKKSTLKVIKEFKGVPHRISYVSQGDRPLLPHFKIYNDAKSTNWDATLTALRAVSSFGVPITLIIGGKKRGVGDEIYPYYDEIRKSVTELYLIGEMAPLLACELRELGSAKKFQDEDDGKGAKSFHFYEMKTLAKFKEHLMSTDTTRNGVLLFSPAFPSFDQFQNYADRGRQFEKLFS